MVPRIKFFSYLLIAIFSLASPLLADVNDDIYGLEDIKEEEYPGPFRIEGEFDTVRSASIKNDKYKGQELGFSNWRAAAGSAFCYLAYAREAYAAALSYNYTRLCWEENPYFKQSEFQQYSLFLRLFSNRFCDWIWVGQCAINMDGDQWDFNYYTNYDLTLWGQYDYCENIDLHIGFIVQTGMKIDRVYPIFGFDWEFNKCWKLNAIFPVNISLQYEFDKSLTGSFGMRFFDVRYRVDKDEPLSMGLFSYRNSGVELALLYKKNPCLEGNIHVGSTIGGMVRISDKENKNPKHIKLDPALYVGGELVWSF